MLTNIILLMPERRQQFAIAALLREHNAALSFAPVATAEDIASLNAGLLCNSRLIAFTTGTIVPTKLLAALGYGAYNFHPGPPEYPGWAPAHFAIYDRARQFGATAHVMTERVDEGAIIGVQRFDIPKGMTVRGLEQMAYVRLAHLLWTLAGRLATSEGDLPTLPVEWSDRKTSRSHYAAMCRMTPDLDAAEQKRRIMAFSDEFRGMKPTMTM